LQTVRKNDTIGKGIIGRYVPEIYKNNNPNKIMSPIMATNKKGEGIEPIESGSYPARVYQLIHLGTIAGFEGKMQNKVRIGFELPTELHIFDKEKGEQPRVISKDYTLSFNEKATLTKVITACDPKALEVGEDGLMEVFDVESLVGKDCLITIAQKPKKEGGNYAYIDSTTRLPKGMTCPPAINEPQILNYTNWNEELYQKLPDFLKDKIATSDEYKTLKGLNSPDDVAF